MIELFIVERTDIELIPFALYSVLTDEEKSYILRYRKKEDQINSLIGTLLARYLAERHQIIDQPIKRAANGKPYVANFEGQISISHSEEFIACAVHPNGRIGIDIEKIRQIDFAVATEFLSPNEHRFFQTRESEEEKLSALYTYWTLKESFFKAEGTGLTGGSLTAVEFELSNPPVLRLPAELAGTWKFAYANLSRAYRCSVCYSSVKPMNLLFEKICLDELTAYFVKSGTRN
ncbi:4'-phosphopantetheinyl transferase superfamily protein [Bacillus sp. PK3_68]|uniref:4'-phosphopantetheinyl transferase family protein n=1 Tax=Bacillus sp. PK3_68 TaxID=2027408 RepID=UPI0016049840|nr:4'-phosphopantetheinyl transferase superfamily protein [Bacillus sp. PK3_68]